MYHIKYDNKIKNLKIKNVINYEENLFYSRNKGDES